MTIVFFNKDKCKQANIEQNYQNQDYQNHYFLYLIMKYMHFFIVILFSLFIKIGIAQIQYAELGIDGLTCSQCTRNVELSLRKLEFVSDVQMNLENTQGKILFNANKNISLKALSKAVIDAGFSVRYLTISYLFKQQSISDGFCFEDENRTLQFVAIKNQVLDGTHNLKILGKVYQNKKEYKLWKSRINNTCERKDKPIYHVTI